MAVGIFVNCCVEKLNLGLTDVDDEFYHIMDIVMGLYKGVQLLQWPSGCDHIMNIQSMYLYQTSGSGLCVFRIFFSNCPMKMIARLDAHLVPIVVLDI